MVADVMNAGRLYQGAALQPRTAQRAAGHVAGLERGLLLPMRALLDEVAQEKNLSEGDSDRIIDTDWHDGFVSGLESALLVRDYERRPPTQPTAASGATPCPRRGLVSPT